MNWFVKWLLKDKLAELNSKIDSAEKIIRGLEETKPKVVTEKVYTTIKTFHEDNVDYLMDVTNAFNSEKVNFFLYKFEYIDLVAEMAEKNYPAEFLLYTKIIMQRLRKNVLAAEKALEDIRQEANEQ